MSLDAVLEEFQDVIEDAYVLVVEWVILDV
jgi:hypothetical protein